MADSQPAFLDAPNGATTDTVGDFTVDESGMPHGSDPGSGKEVHSGAFYISAADGVRDLTLGNVPIITGGVFRTAVIDDIHGQIAFTAYDAATGRLDYTYRGLTGVQHPSSGDLASLGDTLRLTDSDGDVATALFRVNFVDDGLTGVPDELQLDRGQNLVAFGGSVLRNDIGPDGRWVVGVEGGQLTSGGDWTIRGDHGTLTIDVTGVPTYQAFGGDEGGVDEFRLLLSDEDGDRSTSVLTFQVSDQRQESHVTTVGIGSSDSGIGEGNSAVGRVMSFMVVRSGDLRGPTTVTWSVQGAGHNAATADDFEGGVLPSGSVTFDAGQQYATISFTVANDELVEANENYTVKLTGAVGAALGPAVSRTGFILDEDGVPPLPPRGEGAVYDSPGPRSTLMGGAGDDTINASTGADELRGYGGADTFAWRTAPTEMAKVWDFHPGFDRLDLTAVLRGAGYTGSDPVANGYITIGPGSGASANWTWVFLDADGKAGPAAPRPIIELQNLKPDGITWSDLTAGPPPAPPPSEYNIAAADADLAEGDSGLTTFTYTVTRSDASAAAVVRWQVDQVGDHPASSDDFLGITGGNLSFAVGETSKTISLDVRGDGFYEYNETFALRLSSVSTGTIIQSTALATIRNDDALRDENSRISFGSSSVTRAEGATGTADFSFIVTRTGELSRTSTVHWSVSGSGQNPAGPEDFAGGALPSGTVTFADGEGSKTIVVHVNGDDWPESDEGFTVTLSDPTRAVLGVTTATGKIINDDGSPPSTPVISLTTTSVTLAEGNSGVTAFNYTLARTGDARSSATVSWSVTGSGDNPASVSDFQYGQRPSGTVAFAAGETTKVITVNVVGDATAEADEGFTLNLLSSSAVLGTSTATGTIVNDDGAAPPPPPSGGGGSTGGKVYNSPGPGSTVTGGAGDDTINASQGSDVLTGGAGHDVFHWEKEPWSPATVTDFKVGEDRVDFSALFRTAGYSGSDPVADKYITLAWQGADTLVLFDRDGTAAGQQWPNYVLKLQGVSNATWAQLAGSGGTTPPPQDPPPQDPPPPPPSDGGSSAGKVYNSPGPGSTVTGSAGDDTLNASQGADVLTGGAGRDLFHWDREPWSPATITDFHVGEDRIDFSALLQASGYTGADPVADKYVSLMVQGSDTLVLFDRDGSAGGQPWPNYVLKLQGVTGVTWAQVSGGGSNPPPPTPSPPSPPPDGGSGEPGRVITSAQYGDTLTGGAGADTLNAGQGPDVLTGAGGADHFVWRDLPWSAGHVTDFTPGVDKLDLRGLLTGYSGGDPVVDHWLELRADGQGNTQVYVDHDGAGGDWPFLVTTLDHVSPAQLGGGDWIVR